MGPTFSLNTWQRLLLIVVAVILQNVGQVVIGGTVGRGLVIVAALMFALAIGVFELLFSLWNGRWRLNATDRLRQRRVS